jgi:hypothetical protein
MPARMEGAPNAPETLAMRHGNGKRGRPDGYNPRRDAKVIGYKHKDLIPIPRLVGLALQNSTKRWLVASQRLHFGEIERNALQR